MILICRIPQSNIDVKMRLLGFKMYGVEVFSIEMCFVFLVREEISKTRNPLYVSLRLLRYHESLNRVGVLLRGCGFQITHAPTLFVRFYILRATRSNLQLGFQEANNSCLLVRLKVLHG